MEKKNALYALVTSIVSSSDINEILKGDRLLEILFDFGYTTFEELKDDSKLNGINLSKENGGDKINISVIYSHNGIKEIKIIHGAEYQYLTLRDDIWYTKEYKHKYEYSKDEQLYIVSEIVIGDDNKYLITYDRLMNANGLVVHTFLENKSEHAYRFSDISLYEKNGKDDTGDDIYERVATYNPSRNELSIFEADDEPSTTRVVIQMKGCTIKEMKHGGIMDTVQYVHTTYYKPMGDGINTIPLNNIIKVVATDIRLEDILSNPCNQKILFIDKDFNGTMHIDFKEENGVLDMIVDGGYVSKNVSDAVKTVNVDIISAIAGIIDANEGNYEASMTEVDGYLDTNGCGILKKISHLIVVYFIKKKYPNKNKSIENIVELKRILYLTESMNGVHEDVYHMEDLAVKAYNEHNGVI